MSEFNYNTSSDIRPNVPDTTPTEPKENLIAGIVGAFLFSLVGGALYFVLYLFGWVASISGIIGVICAIKGYSFFAKKESTKGIVIASIMAVLVLALAWYLSLSYDIFVAYQDWYAMGEIDFTLSFAESVRVAPEFLKEPEVGPAYYGDLAISLLFGIGGIASYLFSKFRKNKAK